MKVFYVYNIHRSAKDSGTVIIQGHCNEHLMKGASVEALVSVHGKWEKIPVKYEIRKVAPALYMVDRGRNYTYFASFFVELGKYIDSTKGRLRLLFSNPDRTGKDKPSVVYDCKLSSIQEKMSELLYCLDYVGVEGNGVTITGWAIGAEKIKVYKIVDKHPVRIKADVRRINRYDVGDLLDDYNKQENVGFRIDLETEETRLLVRLTGEHKAVIDINLNDYNNPNSLSGIIRKYQRRIDFNLKTVGVWGTVKKAAHKFVPKKEVVDLTYDKWREEVIPTDRELEKQRNDKEVKGAKFSVLIPLYKTPEKMLKALIDSLKAQTYSEFEVLLSDGGPENARIKNAVDKCVSGDERFKYIDAPASDTLRVDRREDGSLGISDNTNQALSAAKGDYIVLGDHDDLFTPDALYECAKLLHENEIKDNVVIYSDEDKVNENGTRFFDPHFKPDYNIDLLRSVNYICHMFVASRSLAEELGGFRSEFDGAQDYDFILRCVEKAEKIYHIPKVLYHWRESDASTATNPEAKMYAFDAGQKAIEDHLHRVGLEAEVRFGENLGYYITKYKIQGEPLISIIIPNKDHIDDLKKCIESVENLSTYKNIEFIVVENNSTEDETFKYYEEISKKDNIKVIYWDGIFNYSAINNFGVKESKGEYILLLNNDTEMIEPDAIESMLGFCQREDVGAVGARLYYPDDTLQHAGTIVGILGIAGHAFQFQSEVAGSVYFNRSKMTADYSAVTAACLMTKRTVFDEINGLDEGFKVAFNDVDFCLRIVETGRLIVYDAEAKFYHYESKSRGSDDVPEKQERFYGEVKRFQDRWRDFLVKGDPCYNPNLTIDKQDYSLRA